MGIFPERGEIPGIHNKYTGIEKDQEKIEAILKGQNLTMNFTCFYMIIGKFVKKFHLFWNHRTRE